jgi:serine protease AprX
MKTSYKTFPQSSSVYDPVSGNTYVSQYDVFTVGAGYLDLQAALQSTDIANGSAMSPTAVYNSSTGMVTMSSGSSSVWGSSAAWSGPAVWGNSQFVATNSVMWGASGDNGSSVMWGAGGLWGSSVMWGASNDSGFATIWSNSVMWGASGDWSSSVMWGASADDGE